MTYLDEILKSVATPAILRGSVPDAVIKKALQAGHWAPSVGLTDATKYYLIKSANKKRQLKFVYKL
jgi:nicotinate-nucleotide--dimethylbenzimidazole phosphoribosyltransferase